MEDELGFSSLPLQGRQQLHVTKSVGFTLFVVLSQLWPAHAEDPHLWVFLCSGDPKCTNKTLDFLLTTGCFFVRFFFFFLFSLPATSDYWQLEQSGFCQVPRLELAKTKLMFSWSELCTSLGSTEHLQVNRSSSFWSLPVRFLLLSLLCWCILPQTQTWIQAWKWRECAEHHQHDPLTIRHTKIFSRVRWVREACAQSFFKSWAFLYSLCQDCLWLKLVAFMLWCTTKLYRHTSEVAMKVSIDGRLQYQQQLVYLLVWVSFKSVKMSSLEVHFREMQCRQWKGSE